jgi:hypothetical protein
MDEEDGRPGLLAGTNGQFDALKDACPKSLRLAANRVPHPSSAWVGDADLNTAFPNSTSTTFFGEEGRGCCPGMALSGGPSELADGSSRAEGILPNPRASVTPSQISPRQTIPVLPAISHDAHLASAAFICTNKEKHV